MQQWVHVQLVHRVLGLGQDVSAGSSAVVTSHSLVEPLRLRGVVSEHVVKLDEEQLGIAHDASWRVRAQSGEDVCSLQRLNRTLIQAQMHKARNDDSTSHTYILYRDVFLYVHSRRFHQR